MKKRVFTGAATALITPMNKDGSVNFERLSSLVDEQVRGGIDALVICGTISEKSTLNYEEPRKGYRNSRKGQTQAGFRL